MMERIIRYRRAVRTGMVCLIAAGAMLAYHIAACIWYYLNLTPQYRREPVDGGAAGCACWA